MRAVPLAWFLCFLQEGLAILRHDVGFRDVSQNDVIFVTGLLWATEMWSHSGCAVACMSDDRCVSYSLSKADSNGRRQCRGHSLPVADLGSGVTSQGTRLYSLKDRALVAMATTAQTVVTTTEAPWHKTPCVTNLDCSRPNSECFANKCLCTPGYYYSRSGNSCQSSCPQTSLQQEVVEYPMYYIRGYNTDSLTTSLANCQARCLQSVTCRSLDFRHSTNICSTSTFTPLDVPSAWTASSAVDRLHYYQRVCA